MLFKSPKKMHHGLDANRKAWEVIKNGKGGNTNSKNLESKIFKKS